VVRDDPLRPRTSGATGRRLESIVHTYVSPAWLPSGGIAEVVRGGQPQPPMAMVRLLVRREGSVFCVPREDSGSLDLPTRRLGRLDGDGTDIARLLASEITLADASVEYVGCVRNIVFQPDKDYGWPVPVARFGVWSTHEPPRIPGVWIATGEDSPLVTRHWYPLLSGA